MTTQRPQWSHIPRRRGGWPKRFTHDEEVQIAQRHHAGESYRALARNFDVSETLVKKTVRRVRELSAVAQAGEGA